MSTLGCTRAVFPRDGVQTASENDSAGGVLQTISFEPLWIPTRAGIWRRNGLSDTYLRVPLTDTL